MHGSYRGIILALVGFLTLAAIAPNEGDGAKNQTQTNAQKDEAAKPISGAIADASVSGEKDRGCKQGRDDRQSDLCAQWKAADAARDAAEYGLWSVVIGSVGTGLLIWTLWETRQAAVREQRAYIRVEQKNGIIQPDRPILLPLDIINYGTTPARQLVTAGSTVVRAAGWDWGDDPKSAATEQRPAGGITVHPGTPHKIHLGTEEPLSRSQYYAILSGNSAVFFRGFVDYRDVFGKRRKTTFQFEFHGSAAGDGTNGLLRISQSGNDAT